MNYAIYDQFDDIWRVSTNGVKKAWMFREATSEELEKKPEAVIVETTFALLARRSMLAVWMVSKKKPGVNFCPNPENVFEPYKWMDPSEVVISFTGQDPYPNLRDAVGVAFHSPAYYTPVSAKRIHESLVTFKHIPESSMPSADYRSWLAQGIFMGNRSFTTEEKKSGEHGALWGGVMEEALRMIPINSVVVLLGVDARSLVAAARSKQKIEHSHPVSRAGAFIEKDLFGEINAAVKILGKKAINWQPGPGPVGRS